MKGGEDTAQSSHKGYEFTIRDTCMQGTTGRTGHVQGCQGGNGVIVRLENRQMRVTASSTRASTPAPPSHLLKS